MHRFCKAHRQGGLLKPEMVIIWQSPHISGMFPSFGIEQCDGTFHKRLDIKDIRILAQLVLFNDPQRGKNHHINHMKVRLT